MRTPLLYSFLNLRPGEGRLVGALLAHAVLLGTFRIFVDTVASTLFLVHFESTYLPYVYILVAILVPLIGLVYQQLAERLTFPRLLLITLTTLFVSLIVFRLWLATGDPRWPAFAFYIWTFAIAVLISLEFWGLAGQLLNVEQSKRLFSLISLGELFAIIPFGLAMPVLTEYFRTPDLLWIAGGAMLSLIVLLVWFIRAFRAELVAAKEAEAEQSQSAISATGLAQLFKSNYIRSMMVLMALLTLTYYLLDANFYTLLQQRYPLEAELSQFIGGFYALDSVLVLLANLVAGRILTRFGIRISLFALPGALLLGGLAIALTSFLGAPLVIVFNLALGTKLMESALRYSLNGSATLVLYQPLPAKTRVQAQTVLESIIEPVTGGLTGVGLLLFEKFLGFDPMLLALAMSLFVVPWFGVALWIGRGYTAALLQALNKRRFGGGATLLNDLTTADLLWQKLADPHPNVVIYALAILEEMNHPKLGAGLRQALAHPAPEVRREALRRLERLEDLDAREALRQSVATETDPEVRGAAVRTLAVLEEDETADWIMPYLEDPASPVRCGAIVGLIRNGELSGILLAGEQLLELLNSSIPAERAIAAQVLGEVGEPGFDRHLGQLLQDPDSTVRRAALVAAGQIQSPRLWPLMLDALTSPETQIATAALIARGAAILPQIETSLARTETPQAARLQLVRVLGRIRDPRSTELLTAHLSTPDLSLRHQILASLARHEYRPRPEEQAPIENAMQLEGQTATRLLSAEVDVAEGAKENMAAASSLLQTALAEEFRRSQSRLFFLLTSLYEPQAIQRVQDNLAQSTVEKKAYALEALETLLRSEHKPLVLSLLEASSPAARWQKMQALFPASRLGPAERFLEIAQGNDYSPWVRACALYALQSHSASHSASHPAARSAIERALEATHPLISGTARWLLAGAADGEKLMLSIIEKVLILKTISFFAQTPDQVLAEVAGLLVEVEFTAGQRLFSKNDAGNSLYIIVSGRVRVHDGERLLRYRGERDIVGEMAVLDTEPRTADVTVEEEALLLRLDQSALYELMADHVEVAQGIIRFLLRRMRVMIRESAEARAQNAASEAVTSLSAQ